MLIISVKGEKGRQRRLIDWYPITENTTYDSAEHFQCFILQIPFGPIHSIHSFVIQIKIHVKRI